MKTHIADNIYYVTPAMLRHKLGACFGGADRAVELAVNAPYVSDTRRANINLQNAKKLPTWKLVWLLQRLESRRRISASLLQSFQHKANLNTKTHSDALAVEFMDIIADMARRQGKLPKAQAVCPTCGATRRANA